MGNRSSRLTEQERYIQVKKKKFLRSLKKRYKLQYDAIQPIPYIKDKLFCVDKVFIEGGIQIYITEEDTWVGIESYKGIFTDLRIKAKRRIIKAEAGYGKSTATLQLAYDWCTGVKDSPLKDVEILLLLRLRQLGGITSIYEAIKWLLVPDDQQIKSTDIKNIIESCTSVEILLDGYDEYPDQDTENGSDVIRIITGEMFPKIDVSITTRYTPKEFNKDITKHVKFTGFDDEAKEKYIRKAVAKDEMNVKKIKEALKAKQLIDDLCVVPLLFVMFAHMSNEEEEFLDCESVTDFFRHMMTCFHSHMRNKRRNKNTEPYNSQYEIEHTELDEVAFEGLANENQQLSWDRKMLCDRLGRGLYHHYFTLGLLVEEMVVVMSEDNRQEEHTIIEVHFYHKLFCEWFAAFRLVKIVAATKDAAKVKEVLDKIDPFDLQYLFRFSCGIDSKVSSKIVTYLKRRKDCRHFAILCIMEQAGELDEDIKRTVTEICSEETKLQISDSKLLQRSTIQVLDIASRTEIAVSCLNLDTCFNGADHSEITLKSGLLVPNLSSLEQLEIKEMKGKIFTAEEIFGTIRYGIECQNLTKISFIDCGLPLSFESKSLVPAIKTPTLTVTWKPLDCEFHLDLSSGKWIDFLPASFDDRLSLQQMCSKPFVLQSKEVNQHQPSLIMILKIASSHNIEVSCLKLEKCFTGTDHSEIILESGLRVPKLSSLKQLEIQEEEGKIFTAEEMLGALRYGRDCHSLTKISFIDCVLPLSFDSKSLIPTMKTHTLTVSWKLLDFEFHLDLSSGKWIEFLPASVDDRLSLQQMCSKPFVLQSKEVNQHQPSLIMILKIASSHNIEVSCLKLEKCFTGTDHSEIILESGLRLPKLSSLKRLEIKEEEGKIFTAEEMLGAIRYGIDCHNLTKISFIDCVLPLSFDSKSLIPIMKTHALTVSWKPLDCEFHLDLSSGKWIDFLPASSREVNQHQPSLIMILKVAFSHSIGVSCLNLDNCFTGADHSEIILESGLRVSKLSSLKRLEIKEEKGKIFTEEEILRAIRYGMECHNLTKISFIDCVLPLSFDSKSLISTMKTQALTVTWKPMDCEFHLDLSSGKWIDFLPASFHDQLSLQQMCSKPIVLQRKGLNQHQPSLMMILTIASIHNIAVSCLNLDNCFTGANQSEIILESGLRLPKLSLLKRLEIKEKKGKIYTPEEISGAIRYGTECHNLTKISFIDCVLPLSLDFKSLIPAMKTQKLTVSWKPLDRDFHLDVSSSEWIFFVSGLFKTLVFNLKTTGRNSLGSLCSSIAYLRDTDSIELQMSTILLLEIASSHNIPISDLRLQWSFNGFDGKDIRLKSGLSLSSLSSVEKIAINEGRREQKFTEEEVIGVINYGIKSPRFKELWLHNCKLPSSIKPDIIPEESRSRNIKVISSNEARYLDLISGHWRMPDDIHTITELCSGGLAIDRDTSKSVQRSVIEFLVEASNHYIPIFEVSLNWSFSKIGEDGNIILSSGLSLPIITSIEMMSIQTKEGREMNKHEVNRILKYLQHSQRFKKLKLTDCLLPSSISLGPSLSTLKSREVKVVWVPDSDNSDAQYELDMYSGRWQKRGTW